MPIDPHGQLHAGTIGLFDDEGEWIQTQRLRQKRQQRRIAWETHKRTKEAKRIYGAKRLRPSFFSRVAIFLHLRKPISVPAQRHVPLLASQEDHEEESVGREDNAGDLDRSNLPFDLPHRTHVRSSGYGITDLDPIRSLFLEECGMVRVRSEKVGGWDVVPKSVIRGRSGE
ncbi:hypothetical protein BS50DRAFT_673494 [Corynespora cassiicola Philippines]|uniref:Uncharacterized protein n=1 Tax=Corynespora cassiicola Philippines TaxID=1448308 RepID=A0A2T2NZ86_CORCC|nr:hypothetical protein BS50DRAFT_673494 [Corynespora cassiicola Philippines]